MLAAVLRTAVDTASAQRFRISEYPQEEIEKMLKMCYKAEVMKRNKILDKDKATEERCRLAAKWLCEDRKPGLLLYGRVGSGKTTLARAICKLIAFLYDNYQIGQDRRCSVSQTSAMELSKQAVDMENGRYNQFKFTKMLFLDDVGVEPPTVKSWGNEYSPVVELLYYRYDLQKFTIISSNLTPDEFRQRYGDRVGDRLLEMFDAIQFTQTLSYRR